MEIIVKLYSKTSKRRGTPCSWRRFNWRLNIGRCQFLSSWLLIQCSPNQNPNEVGFFTKMVLQLTWKCKKPGTAKISWRIRWSGFLYHLSRLSMTLIVINSAWCWNRNRHTDQWNRVKNLGTNPPTYGTLLYHSHGSEDHWQEGRIHQMELENLVSTWKTVELDLYHHTIHQNHF